MPVNHGGGTRSDVPMPSALRMPSASSLSRLAAPRLAAGVPKTIVEECVQRLGSIDILINSAGICPLGEVLEFDRSKWDPTVAVNLTAAFEMSFEAAKFMVPQKSGKIINICSMFSFLGGRLSSAYAATKHGIAGFTKAYCDELAEHAPRLLVAGVPLVFDDTREHWVKNQTKETRVVLIIDFDANMPFPVNLYTALRYNLIRHSTEVKTVHERAGVGVPPRPQAKPPQATTGLVSMARHTSPVPAAAEQK